MVGPVQMGSLYGTYLYGRVYIEGVTVWWYKMTKNMTNTNGRLSGSCILKQAETRDKLYFTSF